MYLYQCNMSTYVSRYYSLIDSPLLGIDGFYLFAIGYCFPFVNAQFCLCKQISLIFLKCGNITTKFAPTQVGIHCVFQEKQVRI